MKVYIVTYSRYDDVVHNLIIDNVFKNKKKAIKYSKKNDLKNCDRIDIFEREVLE